MKRSIFAAAVVLLTATTAQAEPITKLHSSGWWDVFYVASSSDKNPMCVMVKAVLPDEAKGGVLVKWTEDSGTAFQVWKPNWRMPEGSMVPVLLTFIYSDRSPLPTTADAKVFRPNLISSTIDKDVVVSFLKGFGDAKKMTINFPQSNEPQWTVAMDGSRNAVGAFVRCIARIRSTAPRQPLLPHQKAQGPDQAPNDVARLGVPHLYRQHVYGNGANEGVGPRWRKANARDLREGEAAQVAGLSKIDGEN